MGCIDCLANLQMINIHGNAVAPFLHVSDRISKSNQIIYCKNNKINNKARMAINGATLQQLTVHNTGAEPKKTTRVTTKKIKKSTI